MTTVSLNGDWQIKPYYGEDWRWRDAHMPVNRDLRHWIPATVPGSVTHDLWQAGEIPDPYFEQNSLLLEWIPARTWVYRKALSLPDSLQGQRARLRFEGIDFDAQVFLNGELLGRHASMYTPVEFEVGHLLRFEGENVVAVVIEAAPHEQPQVSRTSLVRTHKSRMTYWWDFCPRMIHVGLWDSVSLNFSGPARIIDVFVRPALSEDYTTAEVHITTKLDSTLPQSARIETTIRHSGETVAQAAESRLLAPGETVLTQVIPVAEPKLWWPNGYGDHPLYEAQIRVLDGDTVLDSRLTRFGIRRIEVIPNQCADPTARPYTFVVNGRRLYLKGWNWVPMDVLYGVERPARLEHLLTLAEQAHVNLLRVWGGGLIERESFYAQCDARGLMVWQEFILSSSGIENVPSTDPNYRALMQREAERIIPRRRSHPSLVLWCGGNELIGTDDVPLDEAHPLLALLHDVVARLDPDRLWLPTSPGGRVAINTLAAIERDPAGLHDVHGPWEFQGVTGQQTLYNAGASLLHSEFGVEGVTNLRTLNRTIAPEHQMPPTLDNPVWHHLGAWWIKADMWRRTWGDLDDIESLVRATQFMQAEGLRYALEADRRRKYQNSGTLPWQFNEPYPMAACTSAVDYYGRPKPSYYAVARAYAPILVSARFMTTAWAGHETFSADIWANSSERAAMEGVRLTARILAFGGRVIAEQEKTLTLPADSARQFDTIACPHADIPTDAFLLDLALTGADGASLARNRYTFSQAENLAPLLAAPGTTLAVEWTEGGLVLRNSGAQTALAVTVEDARSVDAPGFARFSDSGFTLLPGETRTVQVTWHDVPPGERRVEVAGWNTNRWTG